MQHLCFNGERYKGRYTIAKHFNSLMRQVAAAGDIAFVIDTLEFQPLDGMVGASLVSLLSLVSQHPSHPSFMGPGMAFGVLLRGHQPSTPSLDFCYTHSVLV